MKHINQKDYFNDNIEILEKQIEEYNVYFNKVIKNCLPKQFIDSYLKYNGFHDFEIISLNSNTSTRKETYSNIIITLYNNVDDKTIKIVYNSVIKLQNDFNKNHFEQWSYDDYGIDEFIKLDNGFYSHEVYFPSESYYYVEFKEIEIID